MATADLLEQSKESILTQWESEIRQLLPQLQTAPSKVVRDYFPVFIDTLIETMRSGDPRRCSEKSKEAAIKHAKERMSLEYSVQDIITEYRLLRRLILESTAADLSGMKFISEATFEGVTDSATEYARHELEEEKRIAGELLRERQRIELFIATLTHDMRQPLSAAKFATYVVQRQPDRIDLLTKVTDNLARIERMITDLLDVAQARAGKKLNIKLEECDICSIARKVVDDFRLMHGDRFDAACDRPAKVRCDPGQIQRAIQNLVDNAFKYGWHHTNIEIVCSRSETDVEVRVSNYGPELSEEQKRRMFQPFERIDETRQSSYKGWGLGLPLVKAIAEAHGGSISVESQGNKITFILRLPLAIG